MPTADELKNKIQTLKQAGLPYDDELKQLQELQGETQAEEKPKAESAVVTEAKKEGAEVEKVEFSDTVDVDAFQSAAGFYPPSSAGIWKSTLVEVTSPASGKNQRWFIVETNDDRLDKQGKGVLICDLGRGAFKLQQTLANLGIEYSVDGSQVNYKLPNLEKAPMACESEWGFREDKPNQLGVQSLYAPGKAPESVL